MRTKENEFRPLFIKMNSANHNERIRITQHDQLTIASWFAIKAIVQEYAHGERPISHHTQRARLRTRGLPSLSNWRIWIGTYEGHSPDTLWNSFPFQIASPEMLRRRKTAKVTYNNSQVVSYVIGKVFVVLMRSPLKLLVRRWDYPAVGGSLYQIWPPSGYSFLWPLTPLLNAQAETAVGGVRAYLVKIARREALRQ